MYWYLIRLKTLQKLFVARKLAIKIENKTFIGMSAICFEEALGIKEENYFQIQPIYIHISDLILLLYDLTILKYYPRYLCTPGKRIWVIMTVK